MKRENSNKTETPSVEIDLLSSEKIIIGKTNGWGKEEKPSKLTFDNISLEDIDNPNPAPLIPEKVPEVPVITPPAETPEAKATREANELKATQDLEVAKKFGGTKLDDQGNVVDATGKVLKTSEEVINELQPKAVEVDGKTYKLNDKGDALGEDGQVFKTKAELDEIEIAQNEVSPVVELLQKTGVTPIDSATGKPKVYDDSIEGLINATNDIATIKTLEEQKKLFKVYPRAETFIKHLQAGGTEETFFKEVIQNDYSKVTIDDNNIDQQKEVLRQSFLRKGITPAKADVLVKRSVDANGLLEESKEALVEMKAEQKVAETKRAQDQAINEAAETKRVNDYWEGVKGVVTKGKISDAIIPESERENFFNYMAKSVNDDGHSQAQIDQSQEDIERTIFIDYLRYKKFDFTKLVKEAVNKEKMRSLSSRFASKKALTSTEVETKPNTVKAATNIDLDQLQ